VFLIQIGVPHDRAKRLRMQNLGSEIGEFGRLAIGDFGNRARLGHEPGIGGQQALHIAPNNHFVGVDGGSQYGCGIIGAAAAERSQDFFFAGADETGHHRHDSLF